MNQSEQIQVLDRIAFDLEGRVQDALNRGEVPVLDAVETLRLLRAILDGAPEYKPDIARFKVRAARLQASPENPVARSVVFVADIEWRPAGEEGAQ